MVFGICLAAVFLYQVIKFFSKQKNDNKNNPNPVKIDNSVIIGLSAIGVFILIQIFFNLDRIHFILLFLGIIIIFFLVPIFEYTLVSRYLGRDEHKKAYAIARILPILYPSQNSKELAEWAHFLLFLKDADIEAVKTLIPKYQDFNNPTHRSYYLQILIRMGNFPGILEWFEQHIKEEDLHYYPELLPTYFSALGETGQILKMIEFYSKLKEKIQDKNYTTILISIQFLLFVFSCQSRFLQILFSPKNASLSDQKKEFWMATVSQLNGKHEEAQAKLEALSKIGSNSERDRAKFRLASPLKPISPDMAQTLEEFFRKEFP